MFKCKNTDIIPLDQMGLDMTDPCEVYSWNTRLEGTTEKAKEYAIDNLSFKNWMIRDKAQGLVNFTHSTVVQLSLAAITQYFPDPLTFEDKTKALLLYKDLCVNVINHYSSKINGLRGSGEQKKLPIIDNINFDILIEIITGYYDVINFAVSKTDRITGILMGLSKDRTDTGAALVQISDVIYDYMPMLPTDKHSKENMKRLDNRLKGDPRTILHITESTFEDENEFFSEAIPLKNGVYIKELYDTMGRLLTYREAFETYGLLFRTQLAANYLGPINPVPVMDDGSTPKKFLEDFYASTPEKWRQMMAIVLSCLRINDSSYNKGLFFMDDGLGNTGKSTFMKFLRFMIGIYNCAKLSLSQIANSGNGFCLAVLRDLRICFIFSDENEPDDFYENMANLKELITGDPIAISAKYENDVTINFHGRIAQNINNGLIKSSDNSGSLYKRILGIKCTHKVDPGDGSSTIPENAKIKKNYVERQDWIDWLATEAINSNETKLFETDETKATKAAMEEYNNKVLKFFNHYVNHMQQNWFRLDWLFPAFQVYMENDNNSTKTSFDKFEAEAKKIIARHDSQWTYTPESDFTPDIPKQKNISGITVPLDKLKLVNHDPVYKALTMCTNPVERRFEKYKTTAQTALEKMYHTEKPGSIRKVYYRKNAAEIDALMDMAGCLVATYDTKDIFTPDDIYPLLVEDKWFDRPYLENFDEMEKDEHEVAASMYDPAEKALREHILLRLSKLHYKKGA